MSQAPVISQRIRWATAIAQVLLEDQPATRAALASATDSVEASAWKQQSAPLALLRARLSLSPIEIDALWILVCCELEPPLARAFITASGSNSRTLDVATLERAVAIATDVEIDDGLISNLTRHGLVETAASPDLPTYLRPIRASDRSLTLGRGITALDAEVATFATVHAVDELAARRSTIPCGLLAAFEQGAMLVAHGPPGIGRRTLLGSVASRKNQGVLEIRATRLSAEAAVERRLRAVFREARLFDVVPLFVDLEDTPLIGAIERAARDVRGPILVASTKALLFGHRATVNHEVSAPATDERRAIWSAHLDGASPGLLDAVADSFSVSPATIVAAASSTLATIDGDASLASFATIHTSLRAAMDERLAALATRLTVTQTWDDLVLPTEKQDQLLELLGRIRYRSRVLEDWGFADKVGRGTGLSALLSGPPGTGKTMVAGLVAKELGLDTYQVDLSRIVSKYIGETEKNLSLVFDAAESGHAILLFDEADSLFAKRSEIKSSNDRYANQEVNFLLQRMERFRGVVLLTTNHERAIDEAFRRRLSLHIRFDAPDAEHRAKLWQAMLPARAPIEPDIDFASLGRTFEMAGGYIRNAVVRAAYLAAHDGRPISTSHLSRAARAETEAMGRLVITSSASATG